MNSHEVKDFILYNSLENETQKIPIVGEVFLEIGSGEVSIWLGTGETHDGSYGFYNEETAEYEGETGAQISYRSYISPERDFWEDADLAQDIASALSDFFPGLHVEVNFSRSGSFHEAFQSHEIIVRANDLQHAGSVVGLTWEDTIHQVQDIVKRISETAPLSKIQNQ